MRRSALGIRRIVYTSSAGVYGPTTPRPAIRSRITARSSSPAKAARGPIGRTHRLASVGFRPYIVYGFGRETGLTAGPSLACRAAARGRAYAIPYSGSAGLVYVDDVVAAYEAALLREPDGAHVFNMPGEVVSNDDVIAAIRAVVPDARIGTEGPNFPSTKTSARAICAACFRTCRPLIAGRNPPHHRTLSSKLMRPVVLGAHTFGFAWDCIAEQAVEQLATAGYRPFN